MTKAQTLKKLSASETKLWEAWKNKDAKPFKASLSADSVMVGDSGVDIRTARNAGVVACGVTYGFQPETFIEYPPDFTVDEMGELADRIIPS